MPIKRYGSSKSGAGGQNLPFARAVQAGGFLFVSGQVAMDAGEIIDGGIVPQTHKAIQNALAILKEAGYEARDVVRAGVWLDDPRDFWSFNRIFAEYFGGEHAPARACVQSRMVVDCKVEVELTAFRDPES